MRKQVAFASIALGTSLVVVVLSLEVVLRIAGPAAGSLTQDNEARFAGWQAAVREMIEEREDALALFDATLGWRPHPGVRNGLNIVNPQGLRGERSVSIAPPDDRVRIVAVGDSFTYGTGVAAEEAWPAMLETYEPRFEVLNFGVPGYGPDQVELRFETEALGYSPEIALFGVATPALDRILIRSAAFQSLDPHFLTKPRFELNAAGELELLPNPIRSLAEAREVAEDPRRILAFGADDYWYDPWVYESSLYEYSYVARALINAWAKVDKRFIDRDRPLVGPPGAGEFNVDSVAYRILEALLVRFVGTASDAGAHPMIIALPDMESVARSRSGERSVMEPLAVSCERLGLDCIDVTQAFLAEPADAEFGSWFVDGFHYSAEGNAIAANWIAREVTARAKLAERSSP